jgi:uncharacterized coiled-coil DUF342 family protein
MALSQGATADVNVDEYRTPVGKLLRRFKASLESWKAKYRELKKQIKYFQNRAADARRSRDHWKEQTRLWKASSQQLQAELDQVRAEIADPKSKPTARS